MNCWSESAFQWKAKIYWRAKKWKTKNLTCIICIRLLQLKTFFHHKCIPLTYFFSLLWKNNTEDKRDKRRGALMACEERSLFRLRLSVSIGSMRGYNTYLISLIFAPPLPIMHPIRSFGIVISVVAVGVVVSDPVPEPAWPKLLAAAKVAKAEKSPKRK